MIFLFLCFFPSSLSLSLSHTSQRNLEPSLSGYKCTPHTSSKFIAVIRTALTPTFPDHAQLIPFRVRLLSASFLIPDYFRNLFENKTRVMCEMGVAGNVKWNEIATNHREGRVWTASSVRFSRSGRWCGLWKSGRNMSWQSTPFCECCSPANCPLSLMAGEQEEAREEERRGQV